MVIVLAAVLLLLIVARCAALLVSLTVLGRLKLRSQSQPSLHPRLASASEGGESPSPAQPGNRTNAPAKIATVARLVPNNPTFMSETDAELTQLAGQ